MKLIPLTQGQFAKVDDADFEWLNQWKWTAQWSKYTQSYYVVRTEKHPILGWTKKRTVHMHREIMDTPSGMICDHINHDTLFNCRENLRNVTNSQNSINRRGAQSNNKSTGILGVSPKENGYRARININGKEKRFPTRATIEEAIEDRKAAEAEHYGEFRGRR